MPSPVWLSRSFFPSLVAKVRIIATPSCQWMTRTSQFAIFNIKFTYPQITQEVTNTSAVDTGNARRRAFPVMIGLRDGTLPILYNLTILQGILKQRADQLVPRSPRLCGYILKSRDRFISNANGKNLISIFASWPLRQLWLNRQFFIRHN